MSDDFFAATTATHFASTEAAGTDGDIDLNNFTLDLTDSDLVDNFALIPEGTVVEVQIYGATLELNQNKNKGKRQYVFTFRIVGTEWGKNRQIKVWAPAWSGAMFNLIAILKALGYDLRPGKFQPPAPDELQGKVLQATIKHKPGYKDPSQIFMDLHRFEAVGGGAAPKAGGGGKTDLSGLFD